MKQLPLDIRPDAPARLSNFVPGANGELLDRLDSLAQPRCYDLIYLWGPPGCGRSHLLHATCRAATEAGRPALLLEARQIGEDLALIPGGLLAVDDIDALGPPAQIALFRAFNTARLVGLSLLLAGPVPPRDLALREDLRTRVGGCLTYEVRPLTDEEKADALRRHGAARGMRLEPELIAYLLRHDRRDLPSLLATLDALDAASLGQKRAVTLPLLREVLSGRAPAND